MKTDQTKLVMVQDVTLHYGRHVVLKHVNFSMKAGQIMGVIGPNGAGKTTIMKAMLGLVKVNQGTITLLNERVTPQHHAVLADNVGALIENPALYPFLTGWQQLQLVTKNESQLKWVIAALQMSAYIHQTVKHYSLGMRQKLGIAMALVTKPKLVILDEPMNGLDPQSVKLLRDLMKRLAQQGMAFLISSHILSELEKVIDTVMVIDHGRVVLQTAMQDLQQNQQQKLVLQTTADAQALTWLQRHHYACSQQADGLVVMGVTSLTPLLAGLIAQGVQFTYIGEQAVDLETILLRQLGQSVRGELE
ncbi:ABC transporter ATP-binding protein [Lactiplantibacillus daowaiensis]|uniref:ABC transporter ATP-binding protein n=1 Tax=Lactiplantibacillus daowaiensis TaxID=2559918 RepID=A0ABW1S537_9LACO|nr:ABC transporter ATP-binding protein [Lactiplantibacillus daowaiensis]